MKRFLTVAVVFYSLASSLALATGVDAGSSIDALKSSAVFDEKGGYLGKMVSVESDRGSIIHVIVRGTEEECLKVCEGKKHCYCGGD